MVRSQPSWFGSMSIKYLVYCMLLAPAIVMAEQHPVSMWLAEGAANRIYVLGSVHLLRPDDHPLPAIIDTAYADAESIVMELDMDDIDVAEMQALSNKLGVLPDGTSLRDLMGDASYAEASAVAAELDLPFEMLLQTEPWLAAITLEQLALMRIGFHPQYGIEMYLVGKAAQDNKPIAGFESPSEQLAFLDGLSVAAQKDLLLQTLKDSRDIEIEMDTLVRAWRNGDTEFMAETMLAEMQAYPELYQAVVVDRNTRWVRQIQKLLDDDEDYLIVVGALHLVGPDGVPALLEKNKVPIRQMNESF